MRALLVLAAALLVGCAPMRWHHPGYKTQADYQRDRYDCELQAAAAYPAQAVPQGGQTTAFVPEETRCTTYGNQTTCRTSQGVYARQPVRYVDMNAGNRNHAWDSCMGAKGYSFSH